METLAKIFQTDVSLIKYALLIVFVLIWVGVIIWNILCSNPFHYPYFGYSFDVSNKKNVYLEDYIDRFLIDDDNWNLLCHHQNLEHTECRLVIDNKIIKRVHIKYQCLMRQWQLVGSG